MDKMAFLVDKMILRSWKLDLAGEEIKPLSSDEIQRHFFLSLFSRQPTR